MIETLITFLLISLGFNLLMFIPAFIFKTDKLTDISYSLTFIFLAIYLCYQISNPNIWDYIMVGMVVIWGLRLGGYLLYRVIKTGKDKRFDGIRENFFKFLGFWVAQGLSVWVISIPFILFLTAENRGVMLIPAALGLWMWFEGIVTETVADIQKYRYISKRKKEGLDRHWVDVGLWKISRHPNYLGEIYLWIGVYVLVISRLDLIPALVALIGPIYIYTIIRYFSGVPTLEGKMDKRYEGNKEYEEYKESTGLILPKF